MIMKYYKAVVHPPFRGVIATIGGMTWARGAIFFGSDYLRKILEERGFNQALSITVPPLIIGTLVQIANQPIVRGTITIQDPSCKLPNVRQALAHIYSNKGSVPVASHTPFLLRSLHSSPGCPQASPACGTAPRPPS